MNSARISHRLGSPRGWPATGKWLAISLVAAGAAAAVLMDADSGVPRGGAMSTAVAGQAPAGAEAVPGISELFHAEKLAAPTAELLTQF